MYFILNYQIYFKKKVAISDYLARLGYLILNEIRFFFPFLLGKGIAFDIIIGNQVAVINYQP